MARVALVTIVLVGAAFSALADDLVNRPYLLDSELVSRSISFENRSGAPGRVVRRPVRWVSVAKGLPPGWLNRVSCYSWLTSKAPGQSDISG